MISNDQNNRNAGNPGNNSVVVLFKGGRLPTWHRLSQREQDAFSQEHVDLMLSVSRQYRLIHLEGFRLLSPQNNWQRFWVIEFPSLAGAEAWIQAEMAPPYGRYGYYAYHISRRAAHNYFTDRIDPPLKRQSATTTGDPHRIPSLQIDHTSLVLLTFRRWLPEAADLSTEERGEVDHTRRLKVVAQNHGLIRLELFRLMAPQTDWHEVCLAELPSFAAAEAWMEVETSLPYSSFVLLTMHLAQKWSPSYFARWAYSPLSD